MNTLKHQSIKLCWTVIFMASMIWSSCMQSGSTPKGNVGPKDDSGFPPAQQNFWDKVDGKKTALYILKNKNGMEAAITDYGGRLVALTVPNRQGKLINVVAGFSDIEGYRRSTEPYFGATIGRYGNRIANGRFNLGGKSYQLFLNNGPNTLHGGKKGFQDVVWTARQLDFHLLELSYYSKNGDEGFPGNLKVKVFYELTDNNALTITYEARTDHPTVLNLTNHAFFNLNGFGSGDILHHELTIKAGGYLPVDSTLIPIGRIENVKGTPFDFLKPTPIGLHINDKNTQLRFGKGYDHNFVLDHHRVSEPVATVKGDRSGIIMKVFTDQPGLQFYSGNYMFGKNTMRNGVKDMPRTAFALETQHFPDSPNQPAFPSTLLKPGEVYRSKSTYLFK